MKQTNAKRRTGNLLIWGYLFVLLFAGSGAYAQTRQITGVVSDASGPMVGVAVTVQGTTVGTTTDGQGRYTINAAGSQTLQFSFMGYADVTQVVGDRNVIDVSLEETATGLDEVVVIGYGSVRKRDLTGAVSSVKSDELKMAPVASPLEALQGRVAGLDITRSDGRSTSSQSILLRGYRTLPNLSKNEDLDRDSDPIYIIDGIKGSINNLNPNDIASIDVLKDASSTAIYGSEGANGVIIITTKRAEQGRVQVDFDAYVGINTNGRYPSALQGQDWLNFLKEGYFASNPNADKSTVTMDEILTAWKVSPTIANPYINDGKWIDWVDEALRTGVQQNYNISVRGGNERTQGYFSMGYNATQGIFKNDEARMYTMRAGVDTKITNWLKAGMQNGLTWRDDDKRSSRLNKVFDMVPFGDVHDADGNINAFPIDGMSTVSILADDVPGQYENNTKTLNLTINPYVEITPIPGLSIRSQLGVTLYNKRQGIFDGDATYMKLTGSNSTPRSGTYDTGLNYGYVWENIATYTRTFAEDHTVTATLVSSWENTQKETSGAYGDDFLYNDFLYYNIDAATGTLRVNSDYKHFKKMSIVARVNYSYRGKYLLSVSNRTDGVSMLADKWDSFPAAAVAWRISDEPFMDGTSVWLDNLKLRLGYGVSGNSGINPYTSKTGVTSGPDKLNLGSGQLNTNILTQSIGNPGMGWEKSYNLNVGLDFSLFKGRVDASLEWYNTDTKGVLFYRNMPFTDGGYTPKNPYMMTGNYAKINNRGFELTLNTRNIVTKSFRWTSALTFSTNKDRVKEVNLGSGVTTDKLISMGLFMDESPRSIYNYKKIGIWQSHEAADAAVFGLEPGDSKVQTLLTRKSEGIWVDADGKEYTATSKYSISAKDHVIIGQEAPKWTAGFQNSFYWKNFDLNVFLTMRWGHHMNAAMLGQYAYGRMNIPESYDYWTPENPTNDFPRPYMSRTNAVATAGVSIVEASYMKVKNITLGYTLPKSILDKLGISNLRVYGTMYNPFIWAKSDLLKDLDPEMGGGDDFPMYRQVVFGLNFSF